MNSILQYCHSKITKSKSNLEKWRAWAAKKLRARNLLIDLDICAYGKKHLITKVKPFGKGFVVWSSACNGCVLGSRIQESYKLYKIVPPTPDCYLLKSGLLTQKYVEVGTLEIIE